MKLSVKISIIFIIVVMSGVASTSIALQEMQRLTTALDTNKQITIPLRDSLVLLRNQVDNMLNIKQQMLSPQLTFSERWAYLQQYREQRERYFLTRTTVDSLFMQADFPKTTLLWNQLQAILQEGNQADAQMDDALHRWFSSGIAMPERFKNLLLQFEVDQHNILATVEKAFLQSTVAPNAGVLHKTCNLQLWLDRVQESVLLYNTGDWDGIHTYRFVDGSSAEEIAKNTAIVTQLNALREVHARFHKSLEAAKAALNNGKRSIGLDWLKKSSTAMEAMDKYFSVIREESRKTAIIVQEAQDISLAGRAYQMRVQQAMAEIVTVNFAEISKQEELAVATVENAIYRISLLLGLYITLSFGLGVYTFSAYKNNQHKIEYLERDRQAAFEQMHFLFNTFPMGCMVRNSEFHLRNCNQAAARLFGIEEEWEQMEENARAFGLTDKWEYLERYSDLIYPQFQPDGVDSWEKDKANFAKTFETGFLKTEWVYEAADGCLIPAEVTLVRTNWEDAPAVVYHIRDLREEKALRAQEAAASAYSRALFEEVPLGCVMRDEQGIPLACNKTMCTLIGARDEKEFLARHTEIVPELQPCGRPSAQMITENIATALKTGYLHFDWMFQRLDRELLPVDVVLVRVTLHGKPAVACYLQDMRGIKAMMLEIDKANLHIRTLFDNAPFSCYIRDSWGNIQDCNAETLRMFGLDSKEEFYDRYPSLSPPLQADGQPTSECFTTLVNTAFETGYEVFRWIYLRGDGQPFASEVTLVRIDWNGGPALACYIRPRANENRNTVRYIITRPCCVTMHLADGTYMQASIVDVSLTGVCLRGDASKVEVNQLVLLEGVTPPFNTVLQGTSGYIYRASGSDLGVMFTAPLTANLPLLVRQFNDGEQA